MANGIDLATATNLIIRRHAYSVACFNDFAEFQIVQDQRKALRTAEQVSPLLCTRNMLSDRLQS